MRECSLIKKTEFAFVESNSECDMNLSNRERALLVFDDSFFGRSVFNNVNDWTDCKGELKYYYVKFYVQLKARES